MARNGTPAVEYIYHTEQGSPWWTETKNKVSFDASNDETISTVVEIDGLGRKVRTAKFAQVTDTKGNSSLGWNVSGALEYDEKGRTIKEGQTYFSTAQTPASHSPSSNAPSEARLSAHPSRAYR